MDPESKLLLVTAIGPRTLEMAQRVVHQVAQRIAPHGIPLCLSDGFKGYLPAILGHFGCWVHPVRRQEKGPWPKPRWRPLPGLLYAQVIKEYRPWTPAMAAGLTDHVWTLQEVLLYRVPPWPQPQTV
jgi:hypothetical protein